MIIKMEHPEKRDQSIQTKVALEEDFEFRDLVTQTLEKNGTLAKIKASLRASICLALDEDPKLSQLEPLQNIKLQSYIKTSEGKVMFSVVREFLEYFKLHNTLMVYDSETSLGSSYKYSGKNKMQHDLGLDEGLDNTEELNVPILEQILQIAQSKSKILDINLNVSNPNSTKELITNENSYNRSFGESIDSKLSSFNEDINKRISKLNNATFDLNSPTLNLNDAKNSTFVKPKTSLESVSSDSLQSPMSYLNDKNNTTFLKNRTSLESTIMEDENVINHEKLSIIDENLSLVDDNLNVSLMSPLELEETTSAFNINEGKSLKEEMSKLIVSPPKNKPNLSSLTDLPPLPMNKSHQTNALPPMNDGVVKEKSNLRELDKMFDLTNDYEEDFDLSISKEYSLSIEKSKHKTDDNNSERKSGVKEN